MTNKITYALYLRLGEYNDIILVLSLICVLAKLYKCIDNNLFVRFPYYISIVIVRIIRTKSTK